MPCCQKCSIDHEWAPPWVLKDCPDATAEEKGELKKAPDDPRRFFVGPKPIAREVTFDIPTDERSPLANIHGIALKLEIMGPMQDAAATLGVLGKVREAICGTPEDDEPEDEPEDEEDEGGNYDGEWSRSGAAYFDLATPDGEVFARRQLCYVPVRVGPLVRCAGGEVGGSEYLDLTCSTPEGVRAPIVTDGHPWRLTVHWPEDIPEVQHGFWVFGTPKGWVR
jgi:hypothetical protein